MEMMSIHFPCVSFLYGPYEYYRNLPDSFEVILFFIFLHMISVCSIFWLQAE